MNGAAARASVVADTRKLAVAPLDPELVQGVQGKLAFVRPGETRLVGTPCFYVLQVQNPTLRPAFPGSLTVRQNHVDVLAYDRRVACDDVLMTLAIEGGLCHMGTHGAASTVTRIVVGAHVAIRDAAGVYDANDEPRECARIDAIPVAPGAAGANLEQACRTIVGSIEL